MRQRAAPPSQPELQDILRHQGCCPLLGLLVLLRPWQQRCLLLVQMALAVLAVLAGPQHLRAPLPMLRNPPGAQVLPFQQPGRRLVLRPQPRCSHCN